MNHDSEATTEVRSKLSGQDLMIEIAREVQIKDWSQVKDQDEVLATARTLETQCWARMNDLFSDPELVCLEILRAAASFSESIGPYIIAFIQNQAPVAIDKFIAEQPERMWQIKECKCGDRSHANLATQKLKDYLDQMERLKNLVSGINIENPNQQSEPVLN